MCRKTFFDTLAGCQKVRKKSNSRPSAYTDTVGRELRSKSKSLRSKRLFNQKVRKSKKLKSEYSAKKAEKSLLILTIMDFFDSLYASRCRNSGRRYYAQSKE